MIFDKSYDAPVEVGDLIVRERDGATFEVEMVDHSARVVRASAGGSFGTVVIGPYALTYYHLETRD